MMDLGGELLRLGAQSVGVARDVNGNVTRVDVTSADGVKFSTSVRTGIPDETWRDVMWMQMDPMGFRDALRERAEKALGPIPQA